MQSSISKMTLLPVMLVASLSVLPCIDAMFSLSAERSLRLENIFASDVHIPPETCRSGGKTFVVASTDQTCYMHAADDGSKSIDGTPSWSGTLLSQPSVAATCVDAASSPALFVVDSNGTVRVTLAGIPPRVLRECAHPTRISLAQIDWGNRSMWYPDANGVFALYSCDDDGATRLGFYSLYDATHSQHNYVSLIGSAAPGLAGDVDAAAFPNAGACAAAFALGDRVYSVRGDPKVEGGDFVYSVRWGDFSAHVAGEAVTSVAVVDVASVAYVSTSPSGNVSAAYVLNATSGQRQLLLSGTSGAGVGFWRVLAGNLEDPERDGDARDVLLHVGAAVLRFVRRGGDGGGWTETRGVTLSLGALEVGLALSRGSFRAHPYMNLVAEVRYPSYTSLEYYYGHDIRCSDYKKRADECVAHACTYCAELGICVEGECPACEAIPDAAACAASECLWCDEVMRCGSPLAPCELCNQQSPCEPPCVFCESSQTCYSKDAVCTFCLEYTQDLNKCRASPSCQVCNATQECLSAEDSCFACHSHATVEGCRYDPRCGWCLYTQTCEGVHSDLFNPATPSMCACSDARSEADCSASSACAWVPSESRCVPARCVGGRPGPMDFAATIVRLLRPGAKPGPLDDFDRIEVVGETVGSAADFYGNFYVAGTSAGGPFIIKADSAPSWTCESVFAGPGATITGMAYDFYLDLVYVIGGGTDLPLKTKDAPADVGFSSAVKTEECFLGAFAASDCSLYWMVPWGTRANGEVFTDIEISDDYIAISGVVGPDFPVGGMCAPAQTVGLAGVVLLYDRQWTLRSCHFCGTQMNHLSTMNGRLAAVGVGQYSDRAMLLRYFVESDAWLCDYIPAHADVGESSVVAVFQDPSDDYLVAMVPQVAVAGDDALASRLLVVRFYERVPRVLLETDLLSSDPTRNFTATAVQAVYASFLAMDVAGYVHNETTAHAIFGALKVGYASADRSSVEVAQFAYQVWAPEQGGVSKFIWMDKFLNLIYAGGSTTEDNFLSTTFTSHGPGNEPNPFGILMMRPDSDLQCLPPLPVPPEWTSAEPVLPSEEEVGSGGGGDASPARLVAWPLFNFSWGTAYFGFANSRYVVRIGGEYVATVHWNATSTAATLPFAFDDATVAWSVEARTPYRGAAVEASVTYRVVPRQLPPDLVALAAAGGVGVAAADAAGVPLVFSFDDQGAVVVETAGYSATVALSTNAAFVYNLTGDGWLVFATTSYVYSAEETNFWQLGYPKVTLATPDGASAEWSAASAGCMRRQAPSAERMTFGVPLAADPNDTDSECRWTRAGAAIDMRAVVSVSVAFQSDSKIIVVRVANMTAASSYAVEYAASPSDGSSPSDGDGDDGVSGYAALGLLGLAAIVPTAALSACLAVVYARNKRAARRSWTDEEMAMFGTTASSSKKGYDDEFIAESELVKNLNEFPLLIPSRALNFGYATTVAPIEQILTDKFIIANATGKKVSELIDEVVAAEADDEREESVTPSLGTATSKWSRDDQHSDPHKTKTASSAGSTRSSARSADNSSGGGVGDGSNSAKTGAARVELPPAKYCWRILPLSKAGFIVTFEPDSGCLAPGAKVEVTARLKAKCTTAVNAKVPIAICEGVTFETAEKHAFFSVNLDFEMTSKLDAEEFVLIKPALGMGTFGTVYKATYRGQDVAIKVLKDQQLDRLPEFEKEVRLMEKLKNQYVVMFIGACWEPGKYAIVTELCPLGSLGALLKNQQLSGLMQTKVLLDCAKGMNAIHQASMIHRDLKPDNLLMVSLDPLAAVCCKISDLGTTREMNKAQKTQNYTKGMGTPTYMSPEILSNGAYSTSADVYSFAIIAYYVFTGIEPYSSSDGEDLSNVWKIAEFVANGKRMSIPESVDAAAQNLIRNCWEQDPHNRPTFSDIVNILSEMYAMGQDANVAATRSMRRPGSRPLEHTGERRHHGRHHPRRHEHQETGSDSL